MTNCPNCGAPLTSHKCQYCGAIEMILKNGKKAVFRIDGNSKKKFLMIEWR